MKLLSRVSAAICLFTCSVHSQCSNTHDSTLLLSVSINGYSVDKIGRVAYLDIIDEAAAAIIQTSGQTVGLQSFGGTQTSDEDFTTIYDPADYQRPKITMSDDIQSIISSDFDNNYGNSVSAALANAIKLQKYANVWSPSNVQKYHVLFAAGNPLQGSIGEATNAGDYDDPCADARDAKKLNIQTFVALIGEQGRNFVKEYYSCVVEDPSTDIVIIDPTDSAAGIANLFDRVCKENGYDVRITEVNPLDTTGNGDSYEPFIEILNRGAPLSLRACWDSATDDSCSDSRLTNTNDYFVASCLSCSGYHAYPETINLTAANSSTGWTAIAATGTTELDRVTHGSGDYWQTSQPGRSFELRGVGYNNQYGGNWRVSCWEESSSRAGGTPGYPAGECVATDNSCSDLGSQRSDGSWISTLDLACAANGDSDGFCSYPYSDQFCSCSYLFLGDVDTCIEMPVFSTSCTAYVSSRDARLLEDRLGVVYTHFAVEKPQWDDEVTFSLQYRTEGGTTSFKSLEDVNMGAVDDADLDDTTITMKAYYTAPLSGFESIVETSMTCTVVTLSPTSSPTAKPTAPTTMPTTSMPTVNQTGASASFTSSALMLLALHSLCTLLLC